MSIKFFWYPKCGTCRNAKKWLDENGVDYEPIHIVENPPSEEELRAIVQKSHLPIKKFFNTSGKKYRELGLKDKINEASEEELIQYLASDGMLIKRPLVVGDEEVTVGFKEEIFDQTWK